MSDVTAQFARVCAEGEPLPQDKLIHLYLSRFSKEMVDEALKQKFSTWVQASQYLLEQNRSQTMQLTQWYQLAPLRFKREVEMNKQYVREGWILKNPVNPDHKPHAGVKTGPAGQGVGTNKLVPKVVRSTPRQEKPNFNKFLESLVCHSCKGKGHRAKECPSRDPAAQRDGSNCRRCGGLGHWASVCPSPGQKRIFKRGATPTSQPGAPENRPKQEGNGRA